MKRQLLTSKHRKCIKSYLFLAAFCSIFSLQSQNLIGNRILGTGSSDSNPSGDRFGFTVDINDTGSRIAIAAPLGDGLRGYIQTLEYNTGTNTWSQYGSIIRGVQGFHSIRHPKLNAAGDRLIYGADGYDDIPTPNVGEAIVYELIGNSWVQMGNALRGTTAQDFLGSGVDINSAGDRVVIGIRGEDDSFLNAGAAQVYEYQDTGGGIFDWVQLGSTLLGQAAQDEFGTNVAINSSGDRILISAPSFDGNGSNTHTGNARIFEYQDTGGGVFDWVQLGADIVGEANNDMLSAVSMDASGNRVAVGINFSDGNGSNSGRVQIFDYDSGANSWNQVGSNIDGDNVSDELGFSLQLSGSGNKLIIGIKNGDGSNTDSGTAKVYRYNGTNWIQTGATINGENDGDIFGNSVSIDNSGARVIIGAPFNDNDGVDSGYTEVYGIPIGFLGVDNSWSNPNNWDSGVVPTESSDIQIPNGASVVIDTQNNTINSLSLENGATLIVDTNQSLTVLGDYQNNGSSILNSGATLIIDGDFTEDELGDFQVKRTLTADPDPSKAWYLMFSPISTTSYPFPFLSGNNNFATGSGNNLGIANYNPISDTWSYLNLIEATIATTIGHSVKLASAGEMTYQSFRSLTQVESINNTDIILDSFLLNGGSGNFNLLGNPYTAFIPANISADPTNNVLTTQASSLKELTLWFWDHTANGGLGAYETINQASPARFIAPTQGYFVSRADAGGSFAYTKAMRSHQSTDTFQRSNQTNTRPEIELTVSNGTQLKKADIYYIDGTTKGWDNGYDSTMFNSGGNDTFSIYTHLVSDSQGQNLTIQSLPDSDYENIVIPVGINATNGTEITISANSINFPAEIDLYLEDKNNNSFTLLDNSSDFTTTLTNDLNGIGRFYLHTNTSTVLSTDEVTLENISIYTSERNNLRLTGIQNGNATVKIYNILGKQILQTSFQGSGTNDISLPNLNAGIYIIQLQTETGRLNKKISIQ